jgi:predicted thioesterase
MDSPIEYELRLTVTPEMAAPHLGPAGAVLSTPSMIGLFEQCCRAALLPHVASGDEVIGVGVCITHEAACRVGDEVLVRARQQAAEGTRQTWEVSVTGAEGRRIGGGTLTTEVGTMARPAG